MEPVSTPQRVYEVTDEFTVRTAEITDAEKIVSYFKQNRNYLKPWEPKRDEMFFTIEGWQQRLFKLSELHQHGLGYYLIIVDRQSQDVLGTISFSQISRFPFHACSVGYSLGEQAQGRGIMTQALRLAVDYMFTIQNMHRIMASYMPRNQRSEAVLQRLGFQREGLARDYLLINDKWEDHVLTSLVNPDWFPE
ncbi:ribosomal protein S5-alanine N-acetyltransferase [Vibrio sp.]|uniref:ribosomal protein S5-alanine N-acetyltransferase n=1 Tax=Vibrio sp. TaxID=678 RepID=UPI003D13992D